MVRKILFLIPLLCSAVLSQNNLIEQITYGDFNARHPFIYKDEFGAGSKCIFFELHKNDYSNIYSVEYNTDSKMFEDTVALTFGTNLNINPSFEINSGLLYQTNKNGNWDIALLPDSNGNWKTLKYLTNSLANETEPKFFESINFSHDSVNILFRRDDEIVYLSYKDDQITEEVVFQNSYEFTYTEFCGLDASEWYPTEGLYVFAVEKDNNNQKRIVKKYKQTGGDWQVKEIINDHCDCSDISIQVSDYVWWNLFYTDTLQNQRRYFRIEDPIAASSIVPLELDNEGNLSSFEMYSLLIVGKNLNKNKLDPPFYMPFTYVLENENHYKVRCSLIAYGYWNTDSLVPVLVANPKVAVGPVGLDYGGLVVYTVWEDSIDGHIQIFGTPNYLGYGESINELMLNDFILFQNYPNPFNPTTQINYSIKEAGLVQLMIYDILGKEVANLVNENKEAGQYSVSFDAANLPSGVYIYRIQSGDFVSSKKMILIK